MCDAIDAIIVLRKDCKVWSEPSCPHPEHWTPNAEVLGVFYNSEPDQQQKLNELLDSYR